MLRTKNIILAALLSAVVSAYVEELDDKFKESRPNELWLVEFYAPWCAYCHTFESIWYEVGAELKSMGSPVNVGKIDTTQHTSVASEYNIRGYPTIKLFKGDVTFDYKGQRTKDAIIEFTTRVSGPAVRTISSLELFRHVMSRHDLFFVYIGGESFLKNQFYKAAAEYIIYTYFYTAPEKILPKAVTLQDVPAVAVFKDGTYYIYNEFTDGDLSTWINLERFPFYFQIDSYSLYQMGDLSKLVALAVVDGKNPSEENIRYKTLIERVSMEYRDHYKSNFQFGYLEGNEYINESKIESIEDLLHFFSSVLDGSTRLLGGNGFLQQIKRLYYKGTNTSMFETAPVFTCAVFGIPFIIVLMVIWATCTAVPVDEKPGEGASDSPAAASQGKKAIKGQPESTEKTSEEKKED
ncbi:hypothetical protein DNTS_026041 [Danionella cerebrum]|uniref:protein disulfide-isomerase n=1 Tax=Danionella cerebrum TaxID=2873325 RepID=A0A553Q2I1_9TELE|nr:hypothetical protein DNTS_026041 [Danionella translucida]